MATLPSGYTQLNYIESTGEQYTSFAFVPTKNSRVVMDFQLTTAGTSNQCLFGVTGQFSFRWYGSSSKFRSNGSGSADFPAGIDGTARHTVDKTATSCTLDGTYSVTTTAASSIGNVLYLFAQNAGVGKDPTNYASARVYSCQVYENGSLEYDLVPVMRNSDNAVGLYDILNDELYPNYNTRGAAFVSGGAVDPEPEPDPDPEPDPGNGGGSVDPVGKHNTLIDGTARAITDGKALIDATVYSISKGKILIDGTVYEIAFGASTFTLNITGTSFLLSGQPCYVLIGNKKYGAGNTLTLEAGTGVTCYLKTNSTDGGSSSIYMNGTRVALEDTGVACKYTFYPEAGSTVNIKLTYGGKTGSHKAEITTS